MFLCRRQLEHALDAHDVDHRRRLTEVRIGSDLPGARQRHTRQQTYNREREHARAYSSFHYDTSPTFSVVMSERVPAKFAAKANEMRTECDLWVPGGTIYRFHARLALNIVQSGVCRKTYAWQAKPELDHIFPYSLYWEEYPELVNL